MLTLPLTDETMKYGRSVFVTFLLVLLFVPACGSPDRPILDRPILGRSEISAPTFTIRITEFEEKQFPLSKFSYVFEAKAKGSAEWIPFMTATTDDDTTIPRDQVRVVSEQAAYVFMEDKYAVTTNGGASWYVWNVKDGVRKVEYPGQFFITEVSVNPDGTGSLVVVPRSSDRQTLQLRTVDFGHSWRQ